MGSKLWIPVCTAPPVWVFCLAGLALLARFEEGVALQHMQESLPLIIRSDESLLGKK